MSVNGTNGSNATLKLGAVCAGMLVAGAVGMSVAEPANAAGLEDGSPYAPENWNTIPENGMGVDFDPPGNQIGLGAPSRSAFVTSAATGNVFFRWNTTFTNAPADPNGVGAASVTIGGVRTVLNPDAGATGNTTTGVSFPVSIGETIRFDVDSGTSSGSLTVFDFDAPIPTPAMLPGLIGMGVAFWRKKVSGEQNELETSEEL